MLFKISFTSLLCLLTACAQRSIQPSDFQPSYAQTEEQDRDEHGSLQNALASSDEGLSVHPRGLARNASPFYQQAISHIEHPSVKKWIRYFKEDDSERFARFLNRGSYYREFMEKSLTDVGLPKELYYLALIESGFYTQARSHAAAVGIWQFIAPTARRYGLIVDNEIDERMDPIKSTQAAATYLQDLYRVYQSWWLAIASYNSGELRVLNAIMKGSSRQYFDLVAEKALPPETRDYVPKFIAALYLGENHRKFGFKIARSGSFKGHSFAKLTAPAGVIFRDLAQTLGCKEEQLRALNPHFRNLTLHRTRTVTFYAPDSCQNNAPALLSLAALGKERLSSRSGRNKILAASQPTALQASRTSASSRGKTASSSLSRYTVKRGDNLTDIAEKLQVSIDEIKRDNKLRSDHLRPGQKLKIKRENWIVHQVKKGENLFSIAKKYKTTVRLIKQANSLRRSMIAPGQLIRIAERLHTSDTQFM